MTYIIGIDAGGTKTNAIIMDQQKNILFSVEVGFGNLQVDFQEASCHIWKAITKCLGSIYGERCKVIVAGIAGIEAKNHRVRLERFLRERTLLPIILVNDAILAYHAMLGNEDGVLTIAGTGSISYGRNGDKEGYTGGWGHLLGDEGSSYHVVMQAFRKITAEADQACPHSSLSRVLLHEISAKRAEEIKEFIYQANKGEIAALSVVVFSEAVKGDQEAREHFYRAGQELAKQTARLYHKLQLARPLKLASKGSLLEKNLYVQSEYEKVLSSMVGDVEWIRDEKNVSATGALSLASHYIEEE